MGPDTNKGNVDEKQFSDFLSKGARSVAGALKPLPGFSFLFRNTGRLMTG